MPRVAMMPYPATLTSRQRTATAHAHGPGERGKRGPWFQPGVPSTIPLHVHQSWGWCNDKVRRRHESREDPHLLWPPEYGDEPWRHPMWVVSSAELPCQRALARRATSCPVAWGPRAARSSGVLPHLQHVQEATATAAWTAKWGLPDVTNGLMIETSAWASWGGYSAVSRLLQVPSGSRTPTTDSWAPGGWGQMSGRLATNIQDFAQSCQTCMHRLGLQRGQWSGPNRTSCHPKSSKSMDSPESRVRHGGPLPTRGCGPCHGWWRSLEQPVAVE